MPGTRFYWLTDKSVPFATFLTIIQAYYHPEVRNDNFDQLVEMARAGRGGERMATFKEELARLVGGERDGLRLHAINAAADYDDWDNDGEFLVWLWQELYPTESVPGAH